jgi:hypothetical protein
MWRMKLMHKTLVYFLIVQLAFQLSSYGQKKWDGGGGDSLWSNPNNWQPNGIPDSSDNVILDNQWILSNYHVLLPDSMVTSYAQSIRIHPSQTYQINLIIPSSNTAAPALSLSALDTAIYIGDRGTLLNNAGASAGNPIVLVGKFKIANGGKYIHQTLRGNALLISNLVTGVETQKGIFEFNVPGNSAYTLSASGRTFGSLVLNGQTTTRKTYTSSGINKLTIEGDFIIHEQAGFSSSLTNTISIGGDLIVKGRLYINPVSGDTVGRSLMCNGRNQLISITGLFNQGIHFRKWIINGNYRMVNSTIQIEQPMGALQLTTGSYIDIGSSIIKGVGKVIVDSITNIATSARTIVGADSMSNLQTQQLDIHDKVSFICYGPNAQSTGERFPARISSLYLAKSKEKLHLTKSISITDSLLLNKGILSLPDTAVITIGNYVNQGNDSSFIAGKVIQSSKKLELVFPIGIDTLFAPTRIIRSSNSTIAYAMQVNRFSYNDFLQQTHPPVEKITRNFYWTILQLDTAQLDTAARVEIMSNQIEDASCLVVFDTIDNKWKLTQHSVIASNKNVLSSNISLIRNGKFTIGQLQQHALPLNSIHLKKRNFRNETILEWTVNDDENAQYYLIEYSNDGNLFEPIDTVASIKNKGQLSYKKMLKKVQKNTVFYRVSGVDVDGNWHNSNIVHILSTAKRTSIYPNPSKDKLYIKTNQQITSMQMLYPNGTTNPIIPMQDAQGYYISISSLPIGSYFLRIQSTNGLETIAFIKQ